MKETILALAKDAAADFAYYDRRNDETLLHSQLKEAIQTGVVTYEEIAAAFLQSLKEFV